MTVDTMAPGPRTSPLGRWRDVFAALPAAVQIREVPFLTQLDLRLDASGPAAQAVASVLGVALPTMPNIHTRGGDVEVLWLGPDEWLVVAPPGWAHLEVGLRAGLRGGGR